VQRRDDYETPDVLGLHQFSWFRGYGLHSKDAE
jgi:hypothetical protein